MRAGSAPLRRDVPAARRLVLLSGIVLALIGGQAAAATPAAAAPVTSGSASVRGHSLPAFGSGVGHLTGHNVTGTAPTPRGGVGPRTPVGTNTGDGTWVWQTPAPQGNPIRDMSCPSTTVCVAVGDDGTILDTSTATSGSGATWKGAVSVTGQNLRGVSCASASSCFAVGDGGGIFTSTNPTASAPAWTTVTSPTTAALYGISCTSTILCAVVGANGGIWHATNMTTGPTWHQHTGATATLYAVACPVSTACFAVGAGGVGYSFDASGTSTTTTAQTTGTTEDLDGVSCGSSSACVAVGAFGEATTLASGSWTAQSGSATGTYTTLWRVTCTSTTTCFAVSDGSGANGGGEVLEDSSSTWTAQYPGDGFSIYATACNTTSTCVAGGNGGFLANETSANWASTVVASASLTTGSLNAVSCAAIVGTGIGCTAVGDSGVIATTTNAGTSWTSSTSGSSSFSGVSCWSSGDCVAVGVGGAVSYDASGTWTAITPLSNVTYLNGVSCPTSTFCLAVGDTGVAFTSTNGGSTWSAVGGTPLTVSTYHPNLDGVSCLSSTSCVVVGDHGVIEVWAGGSSWTQEASGVTGDYLGAISCLTISSTPTCYAAGGAGTVLWSDNTNFTTWSVPSPTWTGSPATTDLLGISCMTSGCTVAGESGELFTTNAGMTQFIAKDTGTKEPFAGVSCAGPCWATGYPGMIESNVTIASLSPPSPLAFGTVHSGVGSTLTETISNAGAPPLNMGTITISGTNAADFVLTSGQDHCSNVQGIVLGGTCTFEVTYTPSVDGSETATATILSNASTSPQALSLTGTGAQTEWAFVEGASGTPYYSTWLMDTQTSGWTSMGGTVLGAPQGCWNSYRSKLDVYAVGSDDKIYFGYFSGTTWSGWTGALSSGTSTGPTGQTTVGVACLNNGTANEQLYVHSTLNSGIYMSEYNPSTSTFTVGWTENSCTSCFTATGSPTVHGSYVYVYAVSGGVLYLNINNIGGFGNGWDDLGWGSNEPVVGADVRPTDGYDDVWITTTGGSGIPYHAVYNGSTEVGTPDELGNSSTYLYSWPVGAWNGSAEIHAYGVGGNNGSGDNIYRDTYASGWGGWSPPTTTGWATGNSIGAASD